MRMSNLPCIVVISYRNEVLCPQIIVQYNALGIIELTGEYCNLRHIAVKETGRVKGTVHLCGSHKCEIGYQ